MTIPFTIIYPEQSTKVFCKVDHSALVHRVRKHLYYVRQLRDLVQSTGRPNELAIVYQNNVNILNTKTKALAPIYKDLAFSPTSMAVGHGYVAVGGQRSQICIKTLEGTWNSQITVGGSINNALCITKDVQSGGVRLYVCNNDESIKIFDIPSMTRICELKMPFAVNNVQLSEDGKRMVAVGDSSQVLIFDVGLGSVYTRIGLARGSEAGFSCSWNHLSDKFAVGFQDGTVRVWDTRWLSNSNLNSESSQSLPVALINSTQKGSRTAEACRSVKFSGSAGAVDLLAFSEHLSVVNLVDSRTFTDRQAIRLAPAHSEVNVSGLTFGYGNSRSIFMGLESCVVEYEIDLNRRRCFPSAGIL